MSDTPRVIITGAGGQLAGHLEKVLAAGGDWNAKSFSEAELDITDSDRIREVLQQHRPQWLINAAAYTNVDGAEENHELANRVNGLAVSKLADACNECGATLVHISTDYVFDGSSEKPYAEHDAPNPQNAYGRSKLLGEQNAQHAETHIIVRTAWLYGIGGRNFIEAILARAAKGQPLRVVADQNGSPTYAGDLAVAIEQLMRVDAAGLFHFTNANATTWHGLAIKAIEIAGYDVPVSPTTTAEFGAVAARPMYSVLNCDKFTATTGRQPRPWPDALHDYMRNRKNA